MRHANSTAVGLAVTLCCCGTAAESAAQAPGDTAPRVSVRVQPPQNNEVRGHLLDTFELYFEPTSTIVSQAKTLQDISTATCGHVDDEWVRRVKNRNRLTADVVSANVALTLPPCPFYSRGGVITLKEQDSDKVRAALRRDVGLDDDRTVNRVATINKTTVAGLARLEGGETLNVDFTTASVSHVLKPQFATNVSTALDGLRVVSATLSASPDFDLSLVGEHQPGCEVEPPSERYPFDAEAVAEVLEFNATKRMPRLATVGIVDTGIDKDEARLFLAKGVDGTIGANVGPPSDERFPTNVASYKNRAHGTHVAGLVLGGLKSPRLNAAVRNRIQLKIINIVTRAVRSDGTKLVESFAIPLSNLDAAMDYAAEDPRLPILNLSIETTMRHTPMLRSFEDGDYLAIVAAGNTKRDMGLQQSYPASWRTRLPERFLTVAAVLPNDTQAPFSNHGLEVVDLAAPGCSVRSLLPGAAEGAMSGTSQAAPLVSFTAGLLYSEGLRPREIRSRIRASVKLVAPPLRDRLETMGVLDIPKAISIHEDLVTMDNGDVKRGRLDAIECLDVLDACWPIARIARIVASSDTESSARAWLFGDDGSVVVRQVTMPAGSITLTTRDGKEEPLHLSGIREIMFALRAQ